MHSQIAYPKGRFNVTDLDTTPQEVFTGGRGVSGIRIIGGAAAEIVIFRAVDNSPEYFRINVGIGEQYVDDLPWYAEEGLEVLTASGAGDVSVTVHYFKN